jgi:predicted nucleic-acid-binding Zn-ribbon protein
MTTCAKCDASSWKLDELSVSGTKARYYAVQCTNCNAPAGVVEYNNVGDQLIELEKKVDALYTNLTALSNVMNLMAGRMR